MLVAYTTQKVDKRSAGSSKTASIPCSCRSDIKPSSRSWFSSCYAPEAAKGHLLVEVRHLLCEPLAGVGIAKEVWPHRFTRPHLQ
jgi:hypothetical protein